MDGLESTLNQILGDPESMAQIMSLAQSFGLSPPQQEETAPPPPQDDFLLPMIDLLRKSAADPQETRLLEALKPYFSSERQQRFERAARIARIAQLAGVALRSMNRKE